MASLDGKVSIDVVIKDIVSRPLAHGVIFGAPACELAALRRQLADTRTKLAALEADIAEGRLIRVEKTGAAWRAFYETLKDRFRALPTDDLYRTMGIDIQQGGVVVSCEQPDPATDNIAAAFRSTDTWRG